MKDWIIIYVKLNNIIKKLKKNDDYINIKR